MTKIEAKQMESLLNLMPPKYRYYSETNKYYAVSDVEWRRMVEILTQLREMYFKKLYLEGKNE